jgi:hypothetical protein
MGTAEWTREVPTVFACPARCRLLSQTWLVLTLSLSLTYKFIYAKTLTMKHTWIPVNTCAKSPDLEIDVDEWPRKIPRLLQHDRRV